MSFALDSFNFGIVYKYRDTFLNGVLTTIEIASVCLLLSVFFGIFVALMRMSKNGLLWRPAAAYIQFIRATPLLLQIYLVYYGLPALFAFGKHINELQTGLIALTIHTTPYMAEIIRAGIESIPRGQFEGAMSVGMTPFQRMFHVVLPQALANVTPPLLGQTAILIKDTSLLSIIAVTELMSAGLYMFSDSVVATESYLTTAACYLFIYVLLLLLSHLVRRKCGANWQNRQGIK